LKARQALAHGDVETATAMMKSAQQFNVDFKALGDSPQTVSGMIQRQNQLAELAQSGDRSYNSGAASFLLTQAEALIYYRDFENAEMLIEQARKFPVEFSPAIGNPDQLAAMIEAARRSTAQSKPSPKAEVMKLLSQAQLAMDQEDWNAAQSFVQRAKQLGVADEQFAASETRPWQLALKIQNALNRQSFDPAVLQTTFEDGQANQVVQADYDPSNDTTRNVQVASTSDVETSEIEPEFSPIPNDGLAFYQSGMKAMEAGDETAALAYFLKAWENRQPLNGNQRKAIKDQLTQLMPDTSEIPKATLASQESDIDIKEVDNEYQALFRKLQNEVFKERAAAERLLETNPRESLEKMTMVRGRIAQSNLNADSQRPLLTIIDRDITEMQKYIDQNLPDIMNDEANSARKDDVERRQQRRFDVEYQIQKLVEEFNDLVDEERFAEAQVVARQARELAPDSEMVAVLTEKARFVERIAAMTRIKEGKEQGFYHGMRNVEEAAIGWNDDKLIEFGDAETYLANARKRLGRMNANQYDSESERKIWNTLKTQQVQGEYRGTLAEAMDQLSRQAGVNIVFDDMALAAEGIQKDRTVDMPILSPISLKSALEVILGSAGLVFVVDSEVIKVTSKDSQNTKLKTETYYIGDLVVPMNQNPDPTTITFNQPGRPNPRSGGMMNAAANTSPGGATNQFAMAQQLGNNANSNPYNNGFFDNAPQTGVPTYATMGGQQFGGVTLADFEPLIELIQNTIQNDSWLDTGQGLGTIEAFVPNLSLIVSQTQEVQDEIQDLLKKLRELNDVQIVIEVRFITLQDEFFERVGIDFDFAINDGNQPGFDPSSQDVVSPSTIVGRAGVDPFQPTQDLDIEFMQSSFNAAIPTFGGFQLANAANFGFAILSDIEVFFLIQASKGDSRTNIMQAPTVTMFNGQSASVSDGSQVPFVTSVIPVVGDFAVAHQPVITILPDGANLNVQAVVSDDRRFVRLNMVPFFSQVTDVTNFTFDGSTTTERTTGSVLDDLLDAVDLDGGDEGDEELVTTTQGITIQLPVVAFTSVNTVVSVPDGGTVLLGGIKRMQEGRLESGIPFLSNIPYVNRLFKNVGIGQETSNLMMMVTPRIIIQKELEEDLMGSIN
jgi:general secretion pathway protein D